MPSLNAYLRLSLCTVIDFASFLPPLVTVGRLGSDSGQLELATRGETDDKTSGLTSAAMKTSLACLYSPDREEACPCLPT
jgi:hypothetical protein